MIFSPTTITAGRCSCWDCITLGRSSSELSRTASSPLKRPFNQRKAFNEATSLLFAGDVHHPLHDCWQRTPSVGLRRSRLRFDCATDSRFGDGGIRLLCSPPHPRLFRAQKG